MGDRSQLGPRGYKNRRGPGAESVLEQSEGSLDIGANFLEASFELRYRCSLPRSPPPQLGAGFRKGGLKALNAKGRRLGFIR